MCGRFSLYKISEFLQKYNFEQEMKARYNIAPTQDIFVIKDGELGRMKWGLQFKTNVINTRVETFTEKPFFNHMERILIPADGYYEWKDKQPFRIETGKVFTFAGLTWKGGCSIITLPANPALKKVHDRMPSVLKDEKAWINDGKLDPIQKFDVRKISTLVNVPKNDNAKVLA